jgi:hypothetical protein
MTFPTPGLHGAQTGPASVMVNLQQLHKQLMGNFSFRLVVFPQAFADGLLHHAIKRCGLIRRPFAIGRLRHCGTRILQLLRKPKPHEPTAVLRDGAGSCAMIGRHPIH